MHNRIAADFIERLRGELTADTIARINARNAAPGAAGCATHDFLDANTLMAEAFAASTGRDSDPASDADADLWNAAWFAARAAGFDSRNLPIHR